MRADQARGHYRTTKADWRKVAPYIRYRYTRTLCILPPAGEVFELGCGIGVGLNFLARQRPDLNFTGFDNAPEPVSFGTTTFDETPNLKLVHAPELVQVRDGLPSRAFLVALEVIEHLDDAQLEFFKRSLMAKVDEIVFSFPYGQKDIAGTHHLQSFDVYKIFEIFPGFETVFLRRGSIKFIGYWRRRPRSYLTEPLGIRGEQKSIKRLANIEQS